MSEAVYARMLVKRKPHECDTCRVCDQHCERPANLEHCDYREGGRPCRRLPKCFKCGEPVCRACSSVLKYWRYGKVRLCNDCQIEEDGNSLLVMYRIARQSDYDHAASLAIARQYEESTKTT
jgi:hypothetical protein